MGCTITQKLNSYFISSGAVMMYKITNTYWEISDINGEANHKDIEVIF